MEKCEWKIMFNENEYHYETGCGGEWFFYEGSISENQMVLCPFCGELIQDANQLYKNITFEL